MRMIQLLKHYGRYGLCGLAGLSLARPLSGQAATTTVNVENFDFSPAAVTINVNDSIHWVWVSGFHNSISDPGDTTMWNSGNLTAPSGSFTFSFPAAGTFPYTCTIHGFTGTVTVQGGGNVPPSVAITSPANGATFSAPWTGTIRTTASDTDGTVTKVDFYAGPMLLGTINNPPATPSFTVTNLAAGSYMLTAVATDNSGASTTSAGVSINVVTPMAIVLSSPQRLSASTFQFSYSANPGLTYVVQRGTSLTELPPISTNTATSSTVTFTDTAATGPLNFYGVHLVPNP